MGNQKNEYFVFTVTAWEKKAPGSVMAELDIKDRAGNPNSPLEVAGMECLEASAAPVDLSANATNSFHKLQLDQGPWTKKMADHLLSW